ncbi:hypothetical protein N7535_000980 [Penicillium sp. DV-2018c]|nr:hypothetical protein N7535_000980 [Penicillium sp. DV-2018c]
MVQEMSDFPPPGTPIIRRGFREVCEVDGRTYFKKKGAQEWTEDNRSNPDELKPPEENPKLYLYLVQGDQEPGDPPQWALFLADENEPEYGYIYQVTGDVGQMRYEPTVEKVNITDVGVASHVYALAVVSEGQVRAAQLVKQAAEEEPPPQVDNQKSYTDNCLGWLVRVIARLVKEKIVLPQKLELASSLMQAAKIIE